MLDPRFVAENPDLVKDHLRRRRAKEDAFNAVEAIVANAKHRVALITERDGHRAARNTLSKAIGDLMRAGRAEEAEATKAQVTAGNERTKVLEEELNALEAELAGYALALPNLLHADVPEGDDESANVELRRWGTPRVIENPHAHVEVGERLGLLDLERAAKLTGARFAVLSGGLARMERALINFFLDLHTTEHGYTELVVPYIVHRDMMVGTGQLPKFEADMFKLSEQVNGSDAFLIPTAEVPVTNLHRDEILDESELPKKYVAFTPCFRAEAGSAGRDVRGLIRQHQFHKVELVQLTTPEQSEAAHEALTGHAEACLQRLDLPYRVEVLSSGDIGFGAHKCYDLEVWLPSQGRYREVSSCSNFADFQARRMGLRYRPAGDGKTKTRIAHTLNGSGLAVGRALVAILENYQQADGSVIVPDALRPWMGGLTVLEPRNG